MKPAIFLSALFLCSSVQAGLEGDYELISGSSKCPMGSLQTFAVEGNPGRIFLFGSRHAWTLDMKDVSETGEVVEGGCTYVHAYRKTENSFVNKTTRSNCPKKAWNGVVTEKMALQKNNQLVYEYGFGKTALKCRYTKKA